MLSVDPMVICIATQTLIVKPTLASVYTTSTTRSTRCMTVFMNMIVLCIHGCIMPSTCQDMTYVMDIGAEVAGTPLNFSSHSVSNGAKQIEK